MPHMTNKQRKEIIDKYLTGKYSCTQLAKEYGFSKHSISKFFKKEKILVNKTKFLRKYTIDENYFDKIDTEEKAYF